MRAEVLSSDASSYIDPSKAFEVEEIEASVRKGEIRAESLTGKLAAKIAVSRLLRIPLVCSEIVVRKHKEGDPCIDLRGNSLKRATELGIRNIPVSISHDGGVAVGFAVLDIGEFPNLRIGVDVNVGRQNSRAFVNPQRVFTDQEIEECAGDINLLRSRWSVKESVAKVLVGSGNTMGVNWKTAETYQDGEKMNVRTHGYADKLRGEHGINYWHVQTLRQGSATFAFVIAHK